MCIFHPHHRRFKALEQARGCRVVKLSTWEVAEVACDVDFEEEYYGWRRVSKTSVRIESGSKDHVSNVYHLDKLIMHNTRTSLCLLKPFLPTLRYDRAICTSRALTGFIFQAREHPDGVEKRPQYPEM